MLLECLLFARNCSRYLRLMNEVSKDFYCCSSRTEGTLQNHVINKYFKCYVKGDICYREKMTMQSIGNQVCDGNCNKRYAFISTVLKIK